MDNEFIRNFLVDMVNYQKDAGVSKTIIEKNTGTITLFAFDAGQGLSKHAVPFELLNRFLTERWISGLTGNHLA